tara:strand:+ start:671 stop:1261 length:591 start_codon:yes stop_codon:yes gene_type:complete
MLNCNTIPSAKIFYNRYPFKVTINGNQWEHDAVRFEEMFTWLSLRENIGNYFGYIKVQRRKLALYFKDQSEAEKFTVEFKDIIHEVHSPYSEAVYKEMLKGVFDCREKLYFGKYRYRVELLKHWKSEAKENIKIQDTVTNLYKRGSNRIHRSRSGYTHIVYTNEKHDIAKIKLVLQKESVKDLRVCKLYSETITEK